jgi:hypothetical protein
MNNSCQAGGDNLSTVIRLPRGIRPEGLADVAVGHQSEAALPEYTGEYLVARYADRLPADIVALARDRLASHKIALSRVRIQRQMA